MEGQPVSNFPQPVNITLGLVLTEVSTERVDTRQEPSLRNGGHRTTSDSVKWPVRFQSDRQVSLKPQCSVATHGGTGQHDMTALAG